MNMNNFTLSLCNNLFLGISQLADNVPMGGKNYVEMAIDYFFERTFFEYTKNFNPNSNQPIDLCRAWVEIMNNEGYINKEDYQLSSEEESVKIIINRQNCSYYNYCSTAQKENLPWACPRQLGCKWIASNYSGRQYQLITEELTDENYCRGTIYPGETRGEVLSKDGDTIRVAGERAIVLTTNAFGIMLKTIYNYAPYLLEQVLYESTYYSGTIGYDKVKAKFNDSAREILDDLLETTNRLGNIRYEIMEFDDRNKKAVIRGYGSYMADIFRKNNLFNSPKASCASARGRLAAYFTKAWGEEMACEEMKCEAFGDDYCEFILLPKSL
jgi:hypothetical protein